MKKKANRETSEYELCKLCRINHNQGRRHNFFPRHRNSLSSFLSRFHQKLSSIRSSLQNPSLRLPSQPSTDRLWCVFCDFDIDESESSFLRSNAIKHLASKDHLKNLKHFLWKYGGGMDKLDSFRITEPELAKWEKKCESLMATPSSSETYCGSSYGQSNDIQTNYEVMNSFKQNDIQLLESSISKDVMPLLYSTNENCQVYHPDIAQAGKVGPVFSDVASHSPGTPESILESQSRQQPSTLSASTLSADDLVKTGVCQSIAIRDPIAKGYQSLTQISSGGLVDIKQNVHSEAVPPWLEGIGPCDGQWSGSRLIGAQNNIKKTSKLNPKRVGAAWAEKRRLELEMEKKGEVTVNGVNDNWLPNFGRVWQSGSRKESMKEFKKEKLNVPVPESQAESEPEIKLHPYISKRMRRDTDNKADVQNICDTV
ncbi:TITAN-like protein isoform X2 [Amaranthus tricolor]|uniref:TITAN-like protein isoform X2 n=1 Tax=Amaranthus tricolor TaxID=29722 RepID=UPI002583BBE5|nr:TITAN-like protein isoform X2 [Amaranthus tricolor]